jgi:hypothetical protein
MRARDSRDPDDQAIVKSTRICDKPGQRSDDGDEGHFAGRWAFTQAHIRARSNAFTGRAQSLCKMGLAEATDAEYDHKGAPQARQAEVALCRFPDLSSWALTQLWTGGGRMPNTQVIPVEALDNSFCVRTDRGASIQLQTEDGAPLPLQPGWIPTRLLIGPSEVSVLQLRHITGQAATWFMDANFRFMTNSFAQLPDHSRAAIIDLIAALPNIASNEIASSFSDLSARVASIRLDDVRLFNALHDRAFSMFL